MEFIYYIGCDVSKNELDFSIYQGNTFVLHKEIQNEAKSIDSFFKELKKLPGFVLTKIVVCMEHTGIYNNPLLVYLHKKKGNICLETAMQIKNSQGNVRGKNDKIDSKRIAEYVYTFREKIKLWQPKRDVVQRLARFASDRDRLITVKNMLLVPLKEGTEFVASKIQKESENMFAKTIKAIKDDLEKIEKAIKEVIKSDSELTRLFGLITSVDGIGSVTAIGVIITTNEFKDINDPKKYACYAGVAPFVKESGIFRGKGRVSQMANKTMKTLFHMAALTAIKHNDDLKLYYQRKTKEEKKNKMSVLNAVRNKLIHRIFSCVNRKEEYVKTYTSKNIQKNENDLKTENKITDKHPEN
jgi:transposase